MTQPWTPPSGNNWNDITMLIRQGLGHDMTIPEGDQNKTDANNAINWIGRAICSFLKGGVGFVTGNLKYTMGPVEDGWLLCNSRTIGSDSSGSSLVGAVYQPLYFVLWDSPNAVLKTSSGGTSSKGATSQDDWDANKRLFLPDAIGRTLVTEGIASGQTTNRILGSVFGEESFTDSRTYPITAISVSGNVPSLVIPPVSVSLVSVTASISDPSITVSGGILSGAPGIGTMAVSPVSGGALSGSPGIGTLAVTPAGGGVLSGAPDAGTLAVSPVVINGSGSVSVTSPGCTLVDNPPESTTDVTICGSFTVAATDIATALLVTGGVLTGAPGLGSLAVSSVTGGILSGAPGIGSLAVTPVTGGVLSGAPDAGTLAVSAVTALIADPSINIGGTAITDASSTSETALSGVTATGSTTANPLTQALSQPSMTARLLIKI